MQCQKCCISCDRDRKQCEDWKERRRKTRRAIYQANKATKTNTGGDGHV